MISTIVKKIKKMYPLICILAFISSFLLLFRRHRFAADLEFIFVWLPQAAISKHIGFFGSFWNSYSGCGVPFFPQPWSKFYLGLNIFFRFLDPKNAYILFLVFAFMAAYFAFYYTAKYFYRDRYVATFLALLYVSSGYLYGFFTVNYIGIEYCMMMPLMVMVLHKYINNKNLAYLILLGFISVYAIIELRLIGMMTLFVMVNLFAIFFVYEKYKNIGKVMRYLLVVNGVMLAVNLFKIIPTVQYYFIEGIRKPLAMDIATSSLLEFIGTLNFMFLSGHYKINLHFLSIFLLIAYFFYTPNTIEKASLKTFIIFILLIHAAFIGMLFFAYDFIKTLIIAKILWGAVVPGTLMLGIGVRSFIAGSNRVKERKALAIFVGAWILLYFLYVIKKQSFAVEIMQNVKWPFIFGTVFFAIIFAAKKIKTRKICSLTAILIFGMLFIHTNESRWVTDNSYNETYESACNSEIMEVLEKKSNSNFIHNDVESLYRIMGYLDKEVNIFSYTEKRVPFFSIANFPILFGVSTIHTHDNIILERYFAFIEILKSSGDMQRPGLGNSVLFSPLFALLNVKYIFSYDSVQAPGISFHKELTDKRTKIYKNDNLLPRFFVTDDFISYNSKEEFTEIVDKENINFAKTVLIEKYSADRQKSAVALDYKIKSLSYKNDFIRITLNVNKPSFLVVLDNYYLGWKAYINGREAPIYPAYLTFRTIHLPNAGSYEIEFKYCPTFFKEGVLIAIAVFLLLFLGFIYQLKSPQGKKQRTLTG